MSTLPVSAGKNFLERFIDKDEKIAEKCHSFSAYVDLG
jgi:hypothetical protein